MNDLIVKIEKATRKIELEQIYIGNDHENLQEKLIFQFDEFVDGQGRLEYEINRTKNYIILTKENETYTIPVQNVLTIYQSGTMGKIKFQLVVTEGTSVENVPVFKSNIFYLKCRPSINAVSQAPEGYDLWIEQANAILNEMDNIDLDIVTEDDETKVVITRKDGTEKESIVTSNYDDTEVRELIEGKVDKVEGKGLSTNDYTTAEKTKLANLENYNDTQIKQDIVDLNLNKADKTEIPDISGKQDVLISGTNIKTINNESLLGSGNITIQGGGSSETWEDLSSNVNIWQLDAGNYITSDEITITYHSDDQGTTSTITVPVFTYIYVKKDTVEVFGEDLSVIEYSINDGVLGKIYRGQELYAENAYLGSIIRLATYSDLGNIETLLAAI